MSTSICCFTCNKYLLYLMFVRIKSCSCFKYCSRFKVVLFILNVVYFYFIVFLSCFVIIFTITLSFLLLGPRPNTPFKAQFQAQCSALLKLNSSQNLDPNRRPQQFLSFPPAQNTILHETMHPYTPTCKVPSFPLALPTLPLHHHLWSTTLHHVPSQHNPTCYSHTPHLHQSLTDNFLSPPSCIETMPSLTRATLPPDSFPSPLAPIEASPTCTTVAPPSILVPTTETNPINIKFGESGAL